MGLCQYVDLCFHASSLPCLHTFWHAIPTSFYIFNVFYFLVYIYIHVSNCGQTHFILLDTGGAKFLADQNFRDRPPRGLGGGGGGARANTKGGAPQYRLWKGGLGACPQEILRFYVYSGGFLRMFSCMYTVHIYLQVAVFD